MKKAITILAILIVLVSAVFADTTENHKLKISTQVAEYKPVFQLYFSNTVKSNDTRTTPRTAPNVAEGEDFKSTTYWNEADVIDKTALDISQVNVSATVTAKLTGNVKLANEKVYSLEFKADPLASASEHNVDGTGAATFYIPATKTGSSISGVASDNGITMGADVESAQLSLTGTSGQEVLSGSITATMDTSNIGVDDLATFTFVYPATDMAPVDTYSAFIWLVVSAS